MINPLHCSLTGIATYPTCIREKESRVPLNDVSKFNTL